MDDLITRLEAATEGSEELDAYILLSLIAGDYHVAQSRFNGAWCIYDSNEKLWNQTRNFPFRSQTPFSTSIDAALTLVPEGWFGEIRFGGQPWAWLRQGTGLDTPRMPTQTAPTPALAICIAALKARAHG